MTYKGVVDKDSGYVTFEVIKDRKPEIKPEGYVHKYPNKGKTHIPKWAMPQPKKITGMALLDLMIKDLYKSRYVNDFDKQYQYYLMFRPKEVAKLNLEYMERD